MVWFKVGGKVEKCGGVGAPPADARHDVLHLLRMALPESIRVKLSSEEAGAISITAVVVREMAARELIELMLGIAGKDPGRIHELLLRGTLVSGGTRFRWQGWEADRESIERILATFPDSEPGLPFAPERCLRVVLRGPGCRIDLPREVASKKRLLRRRSYWDVLMEAAESAAVHYVEYSHREHADCYRMEVSPQAAARLRGHAALVGYSGLEAQIRSAALEIVDLFVERAR